MRIPPSLLLLLAASAASASAGEPGPRIWLRVSGDCPSEAAVRRALEETMPDAVFDRGEGAAEVVLEDRGTTLRSTVGGKVREIDDASSHCWERARQAALVIALVLDPPKLGPDLLEPSPATPLPPSSGIALRAPASLPWNVDLAVAAIGAATFEDGRAVTAGGAIRLDVSRGALGASIGAGGLAPMTLGYGDVRVRLTRVPLDVSATASLHRPRYALAAHLGIAAVPFVAAGTNLYTNGQAAGVDVGARAAVTVSVRATRRWSAWLGIEALAVPAPSQVAVVGRGDVGTTPFVFLSAALGASWRIR